MIRFRCPKCDSKMEVDDAFVGRSARCSTCSQELRVPKVGEARQTPGVETPSRPGTTVVHIDGESVEIVPPVEPMAIVAAALVGLSVVTVLFIGLSRIWTPPWTAGMLMGGIVALLGSMIAIPAYNNIRRSRGCKRGQLPATIALLGGGALFLIFAIGSIIGLAQMRFKPPCEENLKHIYTAMGAYADRHGGALPDGHEQTLKTLVAEKYLDSDDWLTCPAYHVPPGTQTYIFTPDININNPAFPRDLMILSDGPPYDAHGDGFVRVLLLDGTVGKVAVANWNAYQRAEGERWNKALNQIRNPQAAKAAAPAAPPPPEVDRPGPDAAPEPAPARGAP